MSRGANDYRYARFQAFSNHEPQVAFGPIAGTTRISGTQIIRPGVSSAGIASNEVRALFHGTNQSFLLEP